MDLLWDVTDKGQWSTYAQELKKHTRKDGIVDDDMVVAFDSSQVKRIDNIYPTNSTDIRYSINENEKQTNKISRNNLLFKETINNFIIEDNKHVPILHDYTKLS
ncbi:MAG: hypothetical protein MR601_04485 [Erysipelotrichaceae bacterium]|nr:hypothetical protein [Erysipelotrichaceae bacterium]